MEQEVACALFETILKLDTYRPDLPRNLRQPDS
jgi:hypothetical protein